MLTSDNPISLTVTTGSFIGGFVHPVVKLKTTMMMNRTERIDWSILRAHPPLPECISDYRNSHYRFRSGDSVCGITAAAGISDNNL